MLTIESELKPNQQRALRALLNTTSIAAAAEESGLGVSTIKRYLTDETFAKAYRESRGLVLQETIASLQNSGVRAVSALDSYLDESVTDDDIRVRAARSILDYLFKSVELERRVRELEDVIARLDALETQYETPDWRRSA